MGWAAGERNLVVNADDRRIAGRDHILVQDAMAVTVEMFRRLDLETNMIPSRYLPIICVDHQIPFSRRPAHTMLRLLCSSNYRQK